MKRFFFTAISLLFNIVFSFSQEPADLNPTFNNSLIGFNSPVEEIAIQNDGKIIVSGLFTQYNGMPCNKIVRLNSDGSIDNNFNIGSGADNTVHAIAIQNDGKILIGGGFQTFNGMNTRRIVRLNYDGSVDLSFNNILTNGSLSSFNNSGSIYTISIQSNGKIIIGGNFSLNNGNPINYYYNLARLDANGIIDINYLPRIYLGGISYAIAINGPVRSSVLLNDGSLFIGGDFTSYYGSTSINRVAHLFTDGGLDANFNAGNTTTTYYYPGGSVNPQPALVMKIAVQDDGKVLVGGKFTNFNGSSRNCILRLNMNGSIDQTFIGTGTDLGGIVQDIAIQSNGKILLAGNFLSYSSNNCSRIVRINSDGSFDNLFSPFVAPTANNSVENIRIQNNGNVIIGGPFTQYAPAPLGGTSKYIAQLNGDCITPPAPTGDTLQALCFGAILSDLDVIGTNIQWYLTPTGGSPLNLTTSLISGNTYYASQTETCESTARLKVSVALYEPINPTFNKINSICFGQNLNELPISSTNNIIGTWSPAVNNTTTTTYTFTPDAGQCANPISMTVTVNPLPAVMLAAFNSFCNTLGIISLSGGTPAGGTYTGTSVNNNAFNTNISPGLYAITYSYTNANGCSDNATQNIEVIFCDYASFSESAVNYFTVYPNPTRDYFTIKSTESYVGTKFTITDMQGKHLFSSTLSGVNHPVSIVHLAPGIYFLHVEGTGTYVKLVKQ